MNAFDQPATHVGTSRIPTPRSSVRQSSIRKPVFESLTESAPPSRADVIRLRYLLTSPLGVRGPFSGRIYRMDGDAPIVEVDPLDAPGLLRSGLFQREKGAVANRDEVSSLVEA